MFYIFAYTIGVFVLGFALSALIDSAQGCAEFAERGEKK